MSDDSAPEGGPDHLSAPSEILHATTVAIEGKAVLILGASGTGKSALALELMSRGAELVADDRTIVSARAGQLIAEVPRAIKGQIEARGIGILNAHAIGPTPVALAICLDKEEASRLPKHYTFARFGVTVPLLYRVPYPHFAPAILQFIKAGRSHS